MVKLSINVVCAIFHKGNKVFAAKRAYGSLKGLYEFPGGKIEKGESLKDALKREIKEELSANISNIIPRETISLEYDDFFIHLHVFDADVDENEIKLNPNIHSEGKFFTYEELLTLPWCSADKALLKENITDIKYKFYNAENADMHPINNNYLLIDDPRKLYDLLSKCWGPESCSKRLAPKWNKDNKTLAQCSPTAYVVQDIFGGEVFGTPLNNGLTHSFNIIDGVIIDLTSEQFHGETVNYSIQIPLPRDEVFEREPEKKQRYLALKGKLDELAEK